jgi:hypothetical protein
MSTDEADRRAPGSEFGPLTDSIASAGCHGQKRRGLLRTNSVDSKHPILGRRFLDRYDAKQHCINEMTVEHLGITLPAPRYHGVADDTCQ